jgi:hypothetical protein
MLTPFSARVTKFANEIEDEMYIMWMRLVQAFSRRDLSHVSDRLPAVLGIATEFQRKIKHVYIAGLWRSDLVRSLPWHMRNISEPDYTRAPSWSWAYVNGLVVYQKRAQCR